MEYTHDQQKAITLTGDSLLVSAAAGSGKTAVLTERVIQKLCADDPVPADSFMILTFTIAAADEMRARISKSLREKLVTHRDPSLIKRQLSRLSAAQISTIHSACLNMIRENFDKIGIDPQFSVADEAHLSLMKADTLDDFVESLYDREDAKILIDSFVRGRDDKALLSALDKGSEFLKNQPYPELFINSIENVDFIGAALDILNGELGDILSAYNKIADTDIAKLSEFLQDESDGIRRVLVSVSDRDFDGAYKAASQFTFKTMPRRPKDADESLWLATKEERTRLKEQFISLRERFLYADCASITRDRNIELPVLKCYLGLCDELNGILLQKRRAERLVSFDDIEKYTLSLLIESYDGKNMVKTGLANELSQRYEEIIVDEYQDCNTTQELIFTALSRDGKNIFTVGDVKQSIYRFRGAEPKLFLHKQENSVYPDCDTLSAPSKIDLSCNFRSHGVLLDFVNSVFDTLMTKSRGIDYADGHRLTASTLYDGTDAASVDISVLVTSDGEKQNVATRVEAEARYVAKKIKSMIGNEKIYDAKAQLERAVEPRDIAVLMRAPKNCGVIFEKALENEGISCINNNPGEKYLDTPEVRNVIAFLQAIDNPYNDIPLITVMYSDSFGFTADELGRIRASHRRTLFYDAVREYANTDKKTEGFVNTLTALRALSRNCSVYDLINAVYEKSGMLIRLSTHPEGEKKRANLMMLCDLAAAYENGRYRGLFSFINYLIKLSEKDSDMPSSRLRTSDNCVNLLSIHRSKGLEYPVVFLVNSGATIRVNESDDILLDSALGAGGMIREDDTHRELSGIVRNIIREHTARDEINEYIRLLYVALTRPKCRLYITACLNAADAERAIIYCDRAGAAPTDSDIRNSPSFIKWLMYSCIGRSGANKLRAFAGLAPATKDGAFCAAVYSIDDIPNNAEVLEYNVKKTSGITSERAYSLITRKLPADFDIPAKLSVSEIKGIRQEDEDGECIFSKPAVFKKPRFIQGGTLGTDRGNATHKFLQFCDFEKIKDGASFDGELARLTQDEFILESDARLVDKQKILNFLNSDIMKMLLKSGECHKEERFMFAVAANELLDTESTQKITVQGVLDCWYVVDGKAVIVDYKTDRVSHASELADRYRVQLDMYEKALYINEGLETSKKYIYSFALEEFITV